MHPDIDESSCSGCGAHMGVGEHECAECGESACPECGSPLEGGFGEKDCTNCEWTEKRYPPGANGFVSYPSPKDRAVAKARYEDQGFQEGTNFDKFMDRTLIAESKRKTIDEKVSPQRQLARNYQEHPLGKVIIGGRRG